MNRAGVMPDRVVDCGDGLPPNNGRFNPVHHKLAEELRALHIRMREAGMAHILIPLLSVSDREAQRIGRPKDARDEPPSMPLVVTHLRDFERSFIQHLLVDVFATMTEGHVLERMQAEISEEA